MSTKTVHELVIDYNEHAQRNNMCVNQENMAVLGSTQKQCTEALAVFPLTCDKKKKDENVN